MSLHNIIANVKRIADAKPWPLPQPEPSAFDAAFEAALRRAGDELWYPVTVGAPPEGWTGDQCGLTHHLADKRGIWVRDELPLPDRWRTIAHELAHAIGGVRSYNLITELARIANRAKATPAPLDPQEKFEDFVACASFLMDDQHKQSLIDAVSEDEEIVVELAVALACATVGVDYDHQCAYLAQHGADATRLTDAAQRSQSLADRLVGWLTGVTA